MQTRENDILILTIEAEAERSVQLLGTVCRAVCFSKSIVGDMKSTMKNWVGGELKTYTDMMNEGIAIVMERLKEEARAIGADAIYGMRFSTPSVTQGAVELIVYGTAVKYLND